MTSTFASDPRLSFGHLDRLVYAAESDCANAACRGLGPAAHSRHNAHGRGRSRVRRVVARRPGHWVVDDESRHASRCDERTRRDPGHPLEDDLSSQHPRRDVGRGEQHWQPSMYFLLEYSLRGEG